MMRDALEKNPDMSEEEAKAVIMRCMKVLHYRDARSLNRVSHGFFSNNVSDFRESHLTMIAREE